MKKNIYILITFIVLALLNSCSDNKDYIIGGTKFEANYMNELNFDVLKQIEATEVVARLFEKAGLKDIINQDSITIIAPNTWSVSRYLRRKNNQALRTNPDATPMTIEDIPLDTLQKMGMYVIKGIWTSENIPVEGIQLKTILGTELILSKEKKNTDPASAWDGGGTPGYGYQYSNFLQENPYIVHVHFKRGNRWELTYSRRSALTDYFDNPECDHVYRMYATDIRSKNGVIHIIYQGDYDFKDHYYYHTLFFFGTRKDDLL